MSKYRKKPVVIEAFQLNERGLVGEDWFWDAVSENAIITHDFGKFHPGAAWCEIKTLEGTMVAKSWRLYYTRRKWGNLSMQVRHL